MQTYLVGGAVRDGLLGLPIQDRDWVVVGSTFQHMQELGFQPVGRDFPVFLHPQTHEQYALARTERKTAKGYHGFAFQADSDVTLEQDLSRRDLTINAMALPQSYADKLGEAGGVPPPLELPELMQHLIDPFRGQRDLAQKTLRHVTLAFREDPVRILRLARFAARFPDFSIAPETMLLMQGMVANGEVASLVAERVWHELARGLMEQQPSRMFTVLRETGALAVLMPELAALWGVPQRPEYHPEIDTGIHTMMVLDRAAKVGASLAVRFACLVHDLGKGATPQEMLPRHLGHEGRSVQLLLNVCERWRIPSELRELASVVAREHGNIHRSMALNENATLKLLERCDALRRPERFADVLLACECDARGRLGFESYEYPQADRLQALLDKALSIDAAAIAHTARAAGLAPHLIGARIRQARVEQLAR